MVSITILLSNVSTMEQCKHSLKMVALAIVSTCCSLQVSAVNYHDSLQELGRLGDGGELANRIAYRVARHE